MGLFGVLCIQKGYKKTHNHEMADPAAPGCLCAVLTQHPTGNTMGCCLNAQSSSYTAFHSVLETLLSVPIKEILLLSAFPLPNTFKLSFVHLCPRSMANHTFRVRRQPGL